MSYANHVWLEWGAGWLATLALGFGALSCGSVLGSDAFQVGECSEGVHQCSSNVQEKCVGGKWTLDDPCTNKTCDVSTGLCAGGCAPEAKRCADNVPQSCSAKGEWESAPSACEQGTHCSGGLCLVACVPGDLRCIGNTPQTCVENGQWQDQPSGPCVHQTCSLGMCVGECAITDARCNGSTPQSCDLNGNWKDEPSCASTCVNGSCPGPSCEGLAETCGPMENENCCLSPVVPGGTYSRANDANYPAILSDFRLDRFEASVGRFRAFVNAWPKSKPASGDGEHTLIAKSGWRSTWDSYLPVDKADWETKLSCFSEPTWSNSPTNRENFPINCLTWFQAFAFCAWDGGRLPTEAEWNYAAAGGSEQRLYPWSNPPSSGAVNDKNAVYFGKPIVNVGGKSPMGDGKWGHAELSGNEAEWNVDYFRHIFGESLCVDCAELSSAGGLERVMRGGNWYYAEQDMLTSTRSYDVPEITKDIIGVRCARTP